MFNSVFQTIAPSSCLACKSAEGLLCLDCELHFVSQANSTCYRCNRLSTDFKTCRSCRSSTPIYSVYKKSIYEGPVKDLILQTKFDCIREGAGLLGQVVARGLPGLDIDLICYVPTASSRVRYRGFDHARLMAVEISKQLNLPLVEALQRDKKNRQLGASRADRRRQIVGSFSMRSPDLVRGKRVLLVDDVVSTNATIEEAAKVLKENGTLRIHVAVAAHNI